jgi:putative membrane protein
MSPLARAATLAVITIGTAASFAAPAAAVPSAPESPSAPASSPATSRTLSASATTSASVSAQDALYLRQAHQTNLAEIAAGKLAQQKGNSQTVKNLGTKFVTDHTILDQALKPVAQTLGVSLPQALNAHQQAVVSRLKAASGPQFDTLFVTTQLGGHAQAMQAGQTEITSGTNPQVVKLARQAAPVIASHHRALEAAAKTLGIPLSATPRPTASPTLPASPQHTTHS